MHVIFIDIIKHKIAYHKNSMKLSTKQGSTQETTERYKNSLRRIKNCVKKKSSDEFDAEEGLRQQSSTV